MIESGPIVCVCVCVLGGEDCLATKAETKRGRHANVSSQWERPLLP